MSIERIKDLYEATPFRPFVLHLADGREVPVHHREFIAAAPSGRTLVVFQPDDRMNIIDLPLVTDAAISPGNNGNGKRRRR